MADRYWVGGTAAWDGTAGTKWALTSGGAGGQAVPTSADDVFFNAASGAATVTISTGNTGAKSINCTGFTGTLAGSGAITVSGSVTLVTGMTVTYTGTLTLNGTGTLTSAGKILGAVTNNGRRIKVNLGDALTTNTSEKLLVITGTFLTNNYNLTTRTLQTSGSLARTINLGSSTITLTQDVDFTAGTNFTFNAETSQINLSASSPFILGSGQTFFNVAFINTTASTRSIIGTCTFNNLSITAPSSSGVTQVTFAIGRAHV